MRETILRRLNRWQAEDQREDLADLYVESSRAEAGEEFRSREDFLGVLVDAARRPGFDMLVAETATLTGFVFGFPVDRDGTWWQGFAGGLPQDVEQLTASGHVFAIAALAVHPYARQHGVAGRLQERLLADNQASLGAAQVPRDDRALRAAFDSWGWREIGQVHQQGGSVVLRALVLAVGERTASRPGGLTHNPHTQRPEAG
ncbi:hypothetical protein [Streptacidiphilus sp. MAP12-16]|uniref:hypothetical protein n=1 Tax=Streptacidiphilus sp. MAP12-16 TaxID=3156300 RepID=UPI00351564AA